MPDASTGYHGTTPLHDGFAPADVQASDGEDRAALSGQWHPDHWNDEAASLLQTLTALPLPGLMAQAFAKARSAYGGLVTYSPKVFIPLTQLCRDVCHYCSFAHAPRAGQRAYLTPDEVRAIAGKGAAVGCGEALFTLGEMPEARYAVARRELDALGFASTNAYCAAMADMVRQEFGLIPHVNAGVMDEADLRRFRTVSGSQGLMLESVSTRLCERGGVHFGSPGKAPARRLDMLNLAGRLHIPFTTGILIGIGETRAERIASLLAIRDLHLRHGHIQEVIVQNFLPKPATRMAHHAPPSFDDLLWTTAVARLILPSDISLQVPPNLSFDRFGDLLHAGLNDWGGISPLTPDHVNPEAAWPTVDRLRLATEAAGLDLVPRTPVYPHWAADADTWLAPAVATTVIRVSDGAGLLRQEIWAPGLQLPLPPLPAPAINQSAPAIQRHLSDAAKGKRLDAAAIITLLGARGAACEDILAAADESRVRQCGDTVTYVVNRNINYTNICAYKCAFCAFSKGKTHDHLRGKPYDLSLDEIAQRTREAHARGATEVCMQGGIHPRFTGADYLAILRAAKHAVPGIHVHAFSPLEVHHGATTLGIGIGDYLKQLRDAGLGSLPGTAAEILTDRVRAQICPDKLTTAEWLDVVGSAHRAGLRTTATIMFGHVEQHDDIAAHLLAIRDLQAETGGFTEFVPLPFVHAESPLYLKGKARRGPTLRETLLMHAISRIVLEPLIPNIQASWVKLGPDAMVRALSAGVNDMGGSLMDESISRAAGASHGQEMTPACMQAIAALAGRPAHQRTTLYGMPAVSHTRSTEILSVSGS